MGKIRICYLCLKRIDNFYCSCWNEGYNMKYEYNSKYYITSICVDEIQLHCIPESTRIGPGYDNFSVMGN